MENNEISIKMQIIGLVYKISRSILFNIGCVVIGFILGYEFFANRQYVKFVQDEDIKCIDRIHQILKQHIELNEEMSEEFSKLKASIKR